MNKAKVIIIYNKIFHYRVPVWNLLANKCDLTVTYSEGEVPNGMEYNFKIKYLPVRRIGKFIIHKDNIRKLVKDYDVVIGYGNIAWLKVSTLPWFNDKKIVFHTLGVSASYSKGFDEKKSWDRIRAFFYRKANALAFYTDYPFQKYEKLGIPREKMFEAPNTVAVNPIDGKCKKDTILMIGTLYRQKGVQLLLESYYKLKDLPNLPVLNIIGSGPDYDDIKKWVDEHSLQDKVKILGAIYDINAKASYFARAIACISPRQAGLTVLESMGYGVPFVTTKNAITGGELLNVHPGVDGVIIDDESKIIDIIKDIANNNDKYIEMGLRAKDFYDNNRTPQHMADGMWAAIKYAIEN